MPTGAPDAPARSRSSSESVCSQEGLGTGCSLLVRAAKCWDARGPCRRLNAMQPRGPAEQPPPLPPQVAPRDWRVQSAACTAQASASTTSGTARASQGAAPPPPTALGQPRPLCLAWRRSTEPLESGATMADALTSLVRLASTEEAVRSLLSAPHVLQEIDKCAGSVGWAGSAGRGPRSKPCSTAVGARHSARPDAFPHRLLPPACLAGPARLASMPWLWR